MFWYYPNDIDGRVVFVVIAIFVCFGIYSFNAQQKCYKEIGMPEQCYQTRDPMMCKAILESLNKQ